MPAWFVFKFFGVTALGEVGDLLRSSLDEATESLRNPRGFVNGHPDVGGVWREGTKDHGGDWRGWEELHENFGTGGIAGEAGSVVEAARQGVDDLLFFADANWDRHEVEVFFFEARARVQLESLDEAIHGRGVEKADCTRGTGFQGRAKN